jgi:Protein of unknown function (DUF3800)
MIDAYIDESGIHDGAEVCLLAGYFGGRGQWRKFDKAWQRVLRDFDLESFHAKDVVKRRDSADLLWGLANVVAQNKICPVAFGVVVQDFFKFTLTERRFLTGATLTPSGKIKESGSPNRPYFVPFPFIIKRVLSYAPVGGKAHFFFGVDSVFSKYATTIYSKLRDSGQHVYQERFGTIAYPDAKNTPALQAADLLVHMVYLDMVNRARQTALYSIPKPSNLIRLLLNNMRHKDDVVFQDGNLMRETLRQIPIEQRGELLVDDLAIVD